MTDYQKYLISPEKAYESMSYPDKIHTWEIIEHDGIAYVTCSEGPEEPEEEVIFTGVHKTQYFYSPLKLYAESYTRYLNGLKHGSAYQWWPDGQLRKSEIFVEGQAHGITRQYYPNGALAYEGRRRYGMVDGITKHWDEDGFQTMELCWDNGNIGGYRLHWYRDFEKVEYAFLQEEDDLIWSFERPDESPLFTFITKWLENPPVSSTSPS